jgi:two-component system OmpR family sensor kinase
MKFRWPWIILPVGLGAIAGLYLYLNNISDPLIYVQAKLSLLIFGLSATLSLVLFGLYLMNQRDQNLVDYAREEFSNDRRRFLQRLDHELKNPLTAVLAGLANLTLIDDPEERTQTLESVGIQVNRIRQLVSELRKLADLETRPLDFNEVDLTGLIENAFQLAQNHEAANQRELALSIPHAPWPLPSIDGDPDLLSLAFHNLLVNAMKFTKGADTIELRAFEDGNQVVIEVADTGPGIPENEIEFIWEELYRGEAARGIPGSGLGLALVKAIITRHQGEISLRSRTGEGTVFTVRLPANR